MKSFTVVPDSKDLETLGKSLNLIVPLSVKECRKQGMRSLSAKARNEVIKNSLVVLQATLGKKNPSLSEFELCAKKRDCLNS